MSEIPTVRRECYACDSEVHTVYVLPCGHLGYCQPCTLLQFNGINESSRRPACDECNNQIPPSFFQSILPGETYAFLERAYPDGTLPESSMNSTTTAAEHTQCPYCNSTACLRCRYLAHPDPCAQDATLAGDVRGAEASGARRCPKCNLLLYKDDACAHMGLNGGHYGCHHEFCFFCGAEWEVCSGLCPDAMEDAQRRHGGDILDDIDDDSEGSEREDFEFDDDEHADNDEPADVGTRDILEMIHALRIQLSQIVLRLDRMPH
ncbi:hypothetical protein E4T47_05081 [Aureobasidium subglaciale]|nr:hypothetical protein E4T47_05081 [Aureobasidium subglaciale]